MSDYQGNIIIKNPATPTGPASTGRAPGMWKLNEVAYWIKQGVWPNPAIIPDTFFPYVSLLLSTTSLGNANNNLFVDSSGVFNTMTRVGNTTQGSITPYGSNWSNYFDGSGDYLTAPDSAVIQFGTGNFTVEGWFNLASFTTAPIFDQRASGPSTNAFIIAVTSAGKMIYYSYSPLRDVTFNTTLSINTWYHFAFVRSGNTGTMYINGVAEATTVDMSGYNNTSSANRIMQAFDPAYATGYLSNFRIVKGTAVYTGNFTPPTAPLTAISGTGLLTCQSNRFIDNSGNNLTITAYGDTRTTDFSPFNPTYPGITYNQSDITNWSGYFDGTGDYLSVPASSSLTLGTGDFTIEMWLYSGANSTSTRLAGNGAGAGWGANKWVMGTGYSGNANKFFMSVNNGTTLLTSTTTFNDSAWHHAAVTRSGNTWRLFVDGVQEATLTSSVSVDGGVAANISIGSGQISGDADWAGFISNFRIVKGTAVYTSNFTPSTTNLTAISGTSLLTLQNAAFTDSSTNNFVITPFGNTTVTGNSPFNTVGYWSNYFDASGDYERISSSQTALQFGTGTFTIEGWVYSTGATGTYQHIITGGSSWTSGSGGVYWYYNGGAPYLGAAWNGFAAPIQSGTLAINTWYHFALVRVSNTLTLYINGSSVSTLDVTGYNLAVNNQSQTNIGGGGWDQDFGGYLSNLRVLKGTALYTSNFTVPTTPLTAITNTSLLVCQSSRFIDSSTNAFTLVPAGNVAVQPFDPFYTATVASNGGSVYFDGSSYLTTQNIPANAIRTANCTIESWVQFTSPGANSDTPFFGNYTGTWTTNSIYWGKHTAYSGRVAFWVNNYSPSTALLVDTSLPTGSWHHYAVTRSGSTWRMFRDGVVVATATWSGDATGSNGLITPGRADVLHLNGYLSDMRVVNGTAMYTSAFTPPTAPLTPTPATVFLLNGMNAGIYDATAINDMTTVGNVQVRYPSPFAPADYWSNYFDGNADYLTIPTNAAFGYGTGDFTIEFWLNLSGVPAAMTVVSNLSSASGTSPHLYIATDGTLRYYTASVDRITSSVVPLQQWTHVALCRSSGSTRMFFNGVQTGSTYSDSNNYGSSNPVGIATYWNGTPVTTNTLFGYLSNLRILKGVGLYTTTFTPPTSPLTAISGTSLLTCQNKTFIDNSANAFTITANGNATAGAIGPFTATGGTSVYFDGTGDYLVAPSSAALTLGSGDFTIEFWLYLNSTSSLQVFYDQRSGAGAYPVIYMDSTTIRYFVSGADRITGSALSSNTWYHIAVSRSGTSTRMFVNGTQSGSTYSDTTNYLASSLFIGADKAPSSFINGYLDELRVTRGVARYTSNFTPPTQPFPIY